MNPSEKQLTKSEIAIAYGNALDRNDTSSVYKLFSADIAYYHFDNGMKRGPIEVCRFIGEKRRIHADLLDSIQWEQSYITALSESIILVHFTCVMRIANEHYKHHCTQRLYFNDKSEINMIDFIDEPAEIREMNSFIHKASRYKKRA